MRVLFVVPNWGLHETRYTSVSINAPKSIPLEFMYIQGLLNKNIDSKILDANVLDLNWIDIEKEIERWSPDTIVINTTLNYIFWRCPPVELDIPKKLLKICKKNPVTTIAIGPHAVVDKKEVIEELGVDYLIIGEPEIALAEFINSKLTNKRVKGLYGKDVDNGISTEVDVSELPIPEFQSIDLQSYENHTWSKSTKKQLEDNNVKGTILEYSRGCIYHCPYCFRKGFRGSYRKKSIDQIEKEIKQVKEKGIKYIYFIDEIFNIPSLELNKLLDILEKENMMFGCQARPDIMTYEMIDKFKKAGCIYIEYGAETLSQEVLSSIKKNIDIVYMKKIILYSYQVFGKKNVECGWINFYTKDIKEILELTGSGKWMAKVVRPYPNTYIGDKIYEMYKVKSKKWEFLLRYLWWSQIENFSSYFHDGISSDVNIKQKIITGSLAESKTLSYNLLDGYIDKLNYK